MIIKEYKIKYTRKEKVNTSIKFNGMNNDLFTLSDRKKTTTQQRQKQALGATFWFYICQTYFIISW